LPCFSFLLFLRKQAVLACLAHRGVHSRFVRSIVRMFVLSAAWGVHGGVASVCFYAMLSASSCMRRVCIREEWRARNLKFPGGCDKDKYLRAGGVAVQPAARSNNDTSWRTKIKPLVNTPFSDSRPMAVQPSLLLVARQGRFVRGCREMSADGPEYICFYGGGEPSPLTSAVYSWVVAASSIPGFTWLAAGSLVALGH